MADSQPQSRGDAISMENSLEISTTLLRFYQQLPQQEELMQQQQLQEITQQSQQPESNNIKSFTRMLNSPLVLLSVNSFRACIFLFFDYFTRFFR